MKPLYLYVSSTIDQNRAYGLFSQLNQAFKEGPEQNRKFKEVSDPSMAHVAIMENDSEVILGNPPNLVRFSLHSSSAANYGVRLICPDDLMGKLLEYSQLLQRDQVLPRED